MNTDEQPRRNEHAGEPAVRRQRALRDSRSHRMLKLRRGDVLEFRGLRIEVKRGTGKLEVSVRTPQPYRHKFVPKSDLTPAPKPE